MPWAVCPDQVMQLLVYSKIITIKSDGIWAGIRSETKYKKNVNSRRYWQMVDMVISDPEDQSSKEYPLLALKDLPHSIPKLPHPNDITT